ncbi:magnesium/cobalt transporter CorA [Aestuariirhabdus litorea]|uniref:Magnesium transport protein CorA n=1 Tax=Aestuariirhabdus litorea TaxID=2528527 RepID=A0A3P3VQJ2_9GAMM|nr:magnesium/cobalt transporter CorA [Aestuariirhabdus litorea]RRJ85062.1 magnesium and cobalt transport protein CorA [Aestuariirhabdus litorea]RWW98287.1 magnesium/cobalt transporter CorA [Endozoicomonadaceae bacterium GTF-13]
MITAYSLNESGVQIDTLGIEDRLPPGCIWLDVVEPEENEREWLDQYFVEEVPDTEDLDEIEATSRFFTDKDGLHILSLFPHRAGKDIRNINVSFNLRKNILITLRDDEVGLFRLVRNYLKRQQIDVQAPLEIMIRLFTAKVDYLADLLEEVYESLEEASQMALRDQSSERDEVLKNITVQEDFNGQIRLNLMDSQRSMRFLARNSRALMDDSQLIEVKEMLRDIDSLLPHTSFLFDKINFLMDATMGFSNLEQSRIIKIFSIAAVVFLPPTVIASAYGMNFRVMPELDWAFGYPMALAMMFMSAASTYLFFKVKGWL